VKEQRYSAYSDNRKTNVTWLGELPKHWKMAPIKFHAKFSGGGTPSKDNAAFWGGDIPWVSPKDMKVPRIRTTQDNVTAEAVDQSSTSIVEEGALLIVVRSGILQHSIPVAINLVPVTLNQDMKAVRFARTAIADYMIYVVIGNQNLLLLEWGKQGATVESIEQEYLSNTIFPLPPVDEQLNIANFLDHETAKIDSLIEKQQQLIKLLKEKRQAAISHAVTKGLNPEAPMRDSGVEWLGEVPLEWRRARLKNISNIKYGIGEPPVYQEEGVSLIRATNIRSGRVTRVNMVKVNPNHIPSNRIVWLSEGDIIVVRSGAGTGDSSIIPIEYDGAIAGFDMVLRVKEGEAKFVAYALLSKYIRKDQIDLEKTRAAQPHLNAEELGDCFIFVPPKEEQKLIIKYIDGVVNKHDVLILKVEETLVLLSERRTAVISAAVTGKIDVRNWRPPTSNKAQPNKEATQ